MPLIEIRQLSEHVRLGLWRIEEAQAPATIGVPSGVSAVPTCTPRQRERLAVQQLLAAMTCDPTLTIDHESSGRPILKEQSSEVKGHISVSHTRGYAALLLSTAGPVGIDIEYRSDRVERIASRFIRPDEPAQTTDEKLLLWSAKEAVYKLFSEDNLLFFDMRALSIGHRCLQVENMKRGLVVDVFYEFSENFVLTYAII